MTASALMYRNGIADRETAANVTIDVTGSISAATVQSEAQIVGKRIFAHHAEDAQSVT